MPRNRGTGSTRKRKPAAPKKQETSETVQMPEQQGEDALPHSYRSACNATTSLKLL